MTMAQWRPTPLIYTSMLLWTVGYCAVMLLPFCVASLLPEEARGRFSRWVILQYGRVMVYRAVWPFVRVKFEDGAAGETRPGIYVFNHRSASDRFLVATLNIPVIQAVNGWPMRLPFFGFFARRGGYIDTTKLSYEEARDRMGRMLERGVSVAAFPEGTRSGCRRMNQFRSGVFKAARELGAVIYPCCIVGNEELPDRRFRFRCGRIRVRLLPPLAPEEVRSFGNAFLLKNHIRSRIQREIERMEGIASDE